MNHKNFIPECLCEDENIAYPHKIYTQMEKPITDNSNNFIKTHRKTQSGSINASIGGNKPTHTR